VLASIASDIRQGIRQLGQSPGFTTVALLSLALGIGANTAIFQLVDAIRLRTLPAHDPATLVSIDFARGSLRAGSFSTRSAHLTFAQWREIKAQQRAFSGVLAWSASRFDLSSGGPVRFAEGLFVSGDFFRILGVNPIVGRTFTEEDDREGCGGPGAVVSEGFWRRELGGDLAAVGRTVTLEGHSFPVIGVTPAWFFGVEVGEHFDVALPLCADRLLDVEGKGRASRTRSWWLSMMGRLAPGWTVERANAHLQALSPAITSATLPESYLPERAKRYLGNKLQVTAGGTGVSELRDDYERSLWLLMATTGLVLLIACANLANLLLARASVRERDMAVRLAIGASRSRLVRQLLVESLLLALTGSALGIVLAQVLSRALLAFISTTESPHFVDLATDWRVLGFAVALAVLTCLLFGLLPALRATRLAPAAALRSGGRSLTAGRQRHSLRRTLVVVQVALSMVLLVGALLFVRSLRNLVTAETGFHPEGILLASVDLTRAQIPPESRPAAYLELQRRIAAIPGVTAAAEVSIPPVSGSSWNNDIGPDGVVAVGSHKESHFTRVGPGYFRTMGTSLLAGREFTLQDGPTAPRVAIVNEVFARRYLGGPDVVGRTFRVEAEAGKPEPLFQIVGIARNTKYRELREDFIPVAFLPASQKEATETGTNFVLHTEGAAGRIIKAVSDAAAGFNPAISLQFRTLTGQLEQSLLRERLMATLSSAFAALAVLLAMLGLYGVIAYMVARRRNEIGVRMALGADSGRVIRLVLRETVVLLAAGLAVGLGLVWVAGRAATALLYGLQPTDPLTLVSAATLLALVALLASFGPARRAAGLEPMSALRAE
jgi:putative ABC transport system permease protein